MPLTAEERARDSARLDKLISELLSALRSADGSRKNRALRALTDYQTSTTDAELISRAEAARAKGADSLQDAGFKTWARVAQELSPLESIFETAAAIAANGKAELIFPQLAASAESMLEMVKELRKTADKVKETAGNVHKLGDLPDALDTVEHALDALKTKASAKMG